MNKKEKSPLRIVVAGTGGQGTITAARLLTYFFENKGHQVISSQLHGMAQRGGSVQSTVMVDAGNSPVIGAGKADIVIGCEPVETVRTWNYISDKTLVLMNTAPVNPFTLSQAFVMKKGSGEYPDVNNLIERLKSLTPSVVTMDATDLAVQAGSSKVLNVVMLGCLLGSGALGYGADEFWELMSAIVPSKLAEINRNAFYAGVEFASTNCVHGEIV